MAFDVISWALGLALTTGGKRFIEKLAGPELPRALRAAVSQWADALPSDLAADPSTLFSLGASSGNAAIALQDALTDFGKIPNQAIWLAALEEKWHDVKALNGEKGQKLFVANFDRASPHLAVLAEALFRACVGDPELNRAATHGLLSRIESEQERQRSISLGNRPSYLREYSGQTCTFAVFQDVPFWEFQLLICALRDEHASSQPSLFDLHSKVFLGTIHFTSLGEVQFWFQQQLAMIDSAIQSLNAVFGTLQASLGASGVPGDPQGIVRFASNLGRGYRQLIDCALAFGNIRTADDDVDELLIAGTTSLDDLIEQTGGILLGIAECVEKEVRRYRAEGGNFTLEASYEILFPESLTILTDNLVATVLKKL